MLQLKTRNTIIIIQTIKKTILFNKIVPAHLQLSHMSTTVSPATKIPTELLKIYVYKEKQK